MVRLTDAIEKYLDEELLTHDEQWYCERCCKKVDARKKIDLWKLPPVLILHLKRFEFDMRTLRTRKIDANLSAPGGVLDLSSYCSSKQREGACYDVVCVANHAGSYDSGHYSATCRVGDAARGAWHVFDDHRVSPLVRGKAVVGPEAYVVFLERHSVHKLFSGICDGATPASDPLVQTLSEPELWPHWDNMRNSIAGDLRELVHDRKQLLSINEENAA